MVVAATRMRGPIIFSLLGKYLENSAPDSNHKVFLWFESRLGVTGA